MMEKDILICGDFMPGGVLYRQNSFVDEDVIKFIKSHQFVVATLECALTDDDDYLAVPSEKAVPKVVVRIEDLERLYALNINVVSLANNHVFDLGIDAYDRLIETLRAHNICFFGAGHNLEEASKPCVLFKNNKKIAFFGCCMEGVPPTRLTIATKDQPGVWKTSIKELTTVLRSARERFDYVFVLPHGGQEHKTLPMFECLDMSKQMVDAGADGVFWSHAHCVQPKFSYKKRPICFGLGSLLFPDVYVHPPRSIFYPDDKFDYTRMELCVNFPKRVDKPTLASWDEKSRKGMVVSLGLKDSLSVALKLCELNRNNILRPMNEFKAVLKAFELWLKSLLFVLPTNVYGAIRKTIYR